MRARSIVALLLLGSGALRAADVSGPIFPLAFSVTRQLTELGPDGSVELQTEPVTETYGESYLVATRAGDDRTIIDFQRREIIEVAVSKGTYWVLSFSRMRELRERIARASAPPADGRKQAAASSEPRISVELVSPQARQASETSRPGVRRYRATVEGRAESVEVWVDDAVKLTARAQDAIRSFETEALGEIGAPSGRAPLSSLLAAIRSAAGGAIPVQTRRPTVTANGEQSGRVVEDVGTRVSPLPAFPKKLLVIPESLKRVSSPLEIMAAYEEEEAALRSRSLAK